MTFPNRQRAAYFTTAYRPAGPARIISAPASAPSATGSSSLTAPVPTRPMRARPMARGSTGSTTVINHDLMSSVVPAMTLEEWHRINDDKPAVHRVARQKAITGGEL